MMLGIAAAQAAEWRIGGAVGAAYDMAEGEVAGGPGFCLRGDGWVHLRGPAWLRLSLDGASIFGHDRIVWNDGGAVYDDDHWTLLTVLRAMAGPELELMPDRAVAPYFGVGAGFGPAIANHDLGGATQPLMDPTKNDLESAWNIDPYTLQVVPAAEVDAGVRIGKRLAFRAEVGYSISYLPAATLRKSSKDLEARRTALALDMARLGVGVVAPL
jgi:hypothetical protein